MSREASPGNLENERKWAPWEPGLTNYLSCIPGSNGVPLSYVIRENDDPLGDREKREVRQQETLGPKDDRQTSF